MKFSLTVISLLIIFISCNKQETEKEQEQSTTIEVDSTYEPVSSINNKYKDYFADDKSALRSGQVKVTFFGVSTLLFDDGETQLLFDGFFSRPSMDEVLKEKISTDKIAVDSIITKFNMNRVKAIFVTHSHYDHAFDAGYAAKKTNAVLFGSQSTLNIGRGEGVPENKLSLIIPERLINFGKFGVIVLESKHSPMDENQNDEGKEVLAPLSQPASAMDYAEGGSYDFIIRYNNKTIYIKPSANYVKRMLDSFEAEVVFIGLYGTGTAEQEFRDEFYTHTIGKLRPKLIIPLHWDNFFLPVSGGLKPFTGSFYKKAEDFDWIIERTKAENIQFKILDWGKSLILFSPEDNFAKYY